MTKKNTPAHTEPAGAPTTTPAPNVVAPAAPTSHPRRPRRARRSRYVLVVGGTPSFGGYVELADVGRAGAGVVVVGPCERIEAIGEAQYVARGKGGRAYVALYVRPRRGSKRTPVPVWSFDPRGLPESWR